SRDARDRLAREGDATPIEWIGRERRYHEKLATPDVTIADLIGEIDMIKHAEGRYLSSEMTMHFGLIPRTNRGIFCMNELPDLSPKIQVGLFNVLEERDIQIRGYPVRMDLDLCLVFSANPEDYTNRGRIVTPLKDRIGSVIRTHENPVVPRISDLVYLAASARGKIELTMSEDDGQEDKVIGKLIGEAVKNLFEAHFDVKRFRQVVEWFEAGNSFVVGDKQP